MISVKNILETIVSHDSVFGNEKSLAEWSGRFLEKNGFTIIKDYVSGQKSRFNVLAERKKDGQSSSVFYYAHMDTVPIYSGWQTDPLKLTTKGDKLYGLGACDMKGGMACLLYGAQKDLSDCPMKIMLSVDEENASLGMWTAIKSHPEWFNGSSYMISAEPGASKQQLGGENMLTLGRRGRVRFLVKFQGYSAHGGHVDRGVNAISMAADMVRQIDTAIPNKHPQLGEGAQFVAKFTGQSKGLSIPDYAELEIERHLVLPETVDTCLVEYRQLADNTVEKYLKDGLSSEQISISIGTVQRDNPYMMPYLTDEADDFVQSVASIVKNSVGEGDFIVNYGRSVGDENVVASELGLKPIIFGPRGGNIHSPNEWVSLKSLNKTAKIYRQIIDLSVVDGAE